MSGDLPRKFMLNTTGTIHFAEYDDWRGWTALCNRELFFDWERGTLVAFPVTCKRCLWQWENSYLFVSSKKVAR